METVVYKALEEICLQGPNGLTLRNLWSKINHHLTSNSIPLSTNVKQALWSNLLNIPSICFECKGVPYDDENPDIQSVEVSESMDLIIVAAEHLLNNFLGIYDLKASVAGISETQRRILERLAIARTDGVAQSELTKELGIESNYIDYQLKCLESHGLIVKQSTIIRKKEAGNDKYKNGSIVNTYMLHLYRYAKHLGHLQRIEITKEDKAVTGNDNADREVATADGVTVERIKDYIPAIRAICDRLEKADGKVLVIPDIKKELGYRNSPGHRAWRNILSRMKDARLVEDFFATVNNKEVKCLRLLKTFSPKTHGAEDDDLDPEQQVKMVKRGQITEQLMELPIELQIYDMIDAAGSEGLILKKVYNRLGINNKRYYPRILDMVSRFGMHLDSERLNRSVVYRVWTSGNYNAGVSKTTPGKQDTMNGKSSTHVQAGKEMPPPTIQDIDDWTSKVDSESSEEQNINDTPLESRSLSNQQRESSGIVLDAEPQIVNAKPVSTSVPLELSSSALPAPRSHHSYTTYPRLGLNTANSQTEQRILEKLQEEKVLIGPELQRLLESLKKFENKHMDKKTLQRCLNKLKDGGHCKCISFAVPPDTNCGRKPTIDVILHPSVNEAEDLSDLVHDKCRFEKELHRQRRYKSSKCKSIPVLNDVERIYKSGSKDIQAETAETMKNNGFVLAKMVRTKLLHMFLWGYVTRLPGWDDSIAGKYEYDQRNPHSTCKLFELDAAIKAMPLELFLQVAGSSVKLKSMVDKCRNGLCLLDLPVNECKCLMGTPATGLISCLIDTLRHLKLIRLIGGELDAPVGPHTTLRHSLELKPYIEEPVGIVLPSTGVNSFDLHPNVRHDFVLASRKDVDVYWNTLEYCYAASDSKAALHAFPGSAVHEIFLSSSWTSVRVMTAHQRDELFKLVANEDSDKKISYKTCEKIAENLSLTLEQVLRVFYDKRQKDKMKVATSAKEQKLQALTPASLSNKRKRSVNNENSFAEESGKLKHAKMFSAEDATLEQNSLHETHMLINEMDGQREAVDDDIGSSNSPINELKKDGARKQASARRSRPPLPKSYATLKNKVKDFGTRAYKSLAVSNAMELFKLVSLSTAKAPEVPNLLAETLQQYSEHDLLTAFNYLRDRNFMMRGNGISDFVLSQQFLHKISLSPFPVNTGKRAVKMTRWLHERENELLDKGGDLSADLQCGDVLQLSVLMCSGEISMFPSLPDEGVGEIVDLKKRKCDDNEACSVEIAKKPKLSDNEIISRKEKGFPGIQLSLRCSIVSRVDAIRLSRDEKGITSIFSLEHNSAPSVHLANTASESTWEAMTCYARHLESSSQEASLLCPNLFKTIYSAIQKAGDEGLSLEGISRVTDVQGENIPELIVEVLEAFGCALKVSAYDSVHVVDSLYRSKYFLTSMGSLQHDLDAKVPESFTSDGELLELQRECYQDKDKKLTEETCTDLELHRSTDEVHHRVTILNHPEEISHPMREVDSNNEIETYTIEKVMLPRMGPQENVRESRVADTHSYKPILPWVNGDGTINELVYKGLVRRVLGIVMQNPGSLEEHIISQMNVLNSQSCRKLLELMILDSHIMVRKMCQSISSGPPPLLNRLLSCSFKKPKFVCKEHLYANHKNISYL